MPAQALAYCPSLNDALLDARNRNIVYRADEVARIIAQVSDGRPTVPRMPLSYRMYCTYRYNGHASRNHGHATGLTAGTELSSMKGTSIASIKPVYLLGWWATVARVTGSGHYVTMGDTLGCHTGVTLVSEET